MEIPIINTLYDNSKIIYKTNKLNLHKLNDLRLKFIDKKISFSKCYKNYQIKIHCLKQ